MYTILIETKKSVNSQAQKTTVEIPSLDNAIKRALVEVQKLSCVFYVVSVEDNHGTFFYASNYNGLEIWKQPSSEGF